MNTRTLHRSDGTRIKYSEIWEESNAFANKVLRRSVLKDLSKANREKMHSMIVNEIMVIMDHLAVPKT